MDISFKLVDAPEEYRLNSQNNISKIYKKIVSNLNDLQINIENQHEKSFQNIEFPSKVDIEVILLNGNDFFKKIFENDAERTLGVFIVTTGDKTFGDDELIDKFVILVDSSEKNFNHLYEKYGKDNKIDFIERYLSTMTHEVQHALEFIENSGGLTPLKVDQLYKKGEFKYNADKCSTGYNLPKYESFYKNIKDEEEIYLMMEERVESKGRDMFYDLNLLESDLKTLIPKKKNKLKM